VSNVSVTSTFHSSVFLKRSVTIGEVDSVAGQVSITSRTPNLTQRSTLDATKNSTGIVRNTMIIEPIGTINFDKTNAHNIELTTSSISFQYYDTSKTSGNFSDYTTYLTVERNVSGSNPSPQFTKGLSVSSSLGITGSLSVGFSSGTSELQVLSTGVNIGNALTDRHLVTGSLNVTGSMTIRSGSITMPNRPAFRVVGTASTDRVAQTTLSGSYASIDYNEGNHYNNSTGIFTAPLTGLYNVYYNGRVGNVNSMQQVIVYKNTSTVQLMWEAPGNTGVAHFGVSGVVKLAAGDTLEAKVAVGSIQFDGNDSWGAAYIG